jgi:hypothetical protein
MHLAKKSNGCKLTNRGRGPQFEKPPFSFQPANFFLPPRPQLPPPPIAGGLGFGSDTWSVSRPTEPPFPDFFNLGPILQNSISAVKISEQFSS